MRILPLYLSSLFFVHLFSLPPFFTVRKRFSPRIKASLVQLHLTKDFEFCKMLWVAVDSIQNQALKKLEAGG